ncbi:MULTISPECIES: hypothetical protein [Pseudoalteromonas]|uniref:Uncharacterized protein n=1 Tax=Pseudoalteromonas luteoviolacea (strain 2ta16) TaxID=1353533 RepID=V4JAI0_PSEL2|nr:MULTISPECIES: hypothetical protein [Pseudoalteromonas]ESP92192.1 hypothetical protein PL2TA16_05029 [Pseudoalteromonas luteoviolacea 2ta16]KZN29299.1 hypothetical protein N483_07645 [Pseudoalteromonas luteoviolacea NCIMB 1944]
MKLNKTIIKKLSLNNKEIQKSKTDKVAGGAGQHSGEYSCHALD